MSSNNSNPEPTFAQRVTTQGRLGVFAGWGRPRILIAKCSGDTDVSIVLDTDVNYSEVLMKSSSQSFDDQFSARAQLGILPSVAIAGCDLMGSCLYTSGVCASNSGKLAPLGLSIVGIMLYYFKDVYCEAVTAIPVNGGTYNTMLNTASKKAAAFVACLSILSYTATSIVSAFDASVYLSSIWLWESTHIRGTTVFIMILFGVITMCGIGESSVVSIILFSIHMCVLTSLVVWGLAYGIQDNFELFVENLNTDLPPLITSTGATIASSGYVLSLFFGYSSALLGITGFETAANYVEDMKSSKVFINTANWLCLLVAVYNPLISLTSMMVLPMSEIIKYEGNMLSEMALVVGGEEFNRLVTFDAFIILCGGVLTAYVGVCGLIRRLAKDKILPDILQTENWRGAPYISIIAFTLLTVSLFLVIYDEKDHLSINTFGGVFGISFLCVLTAFTISSLLLKLYRPNLSRLVISSWGQVYACLLLVISGLIGNILLTPDAFYTFFLYLSGFILVVTFMFSQVQVYSCVIWIIAKIFSVIYENDFEITPAQIVAANKRQNMFDERGDLSRCIKVVHRDKSESSERKANSLDSSSVNILRAVRKHRPESSLECIDVSDKRVEGIKELLEIPRVGAILKFCISSLDSVVDSPFVYLAKKADPVSLLHAVEYIGANELTNKIYIVHICDDRTALGMYNEFSRQAQEQVYRGSVSNSEVENHSDKFLLQMFSQENKIESRSIANQRESYFASLPSNARDLCKYTYALDAFYASKNIHCVIVRGLFFCPLAVRKVAEYLKVSMHSMIMGVPDEKFPFSFAKLRGCRIAVPSIDSAVYRGSRKRLNEVFEEATELLRTSTKSTNIPTSETNSISYSGRENAPGNRDSPFPYGSIELVISPDDRYQGNFDKDSHSSSDIEDEETEKTKLLSV